MQDLVSSVKHLSNAVFFCKGLNKSAVNRVGHKHCEFAQRTALPLIAATLLAGVRRVVVAPLFNMDEIIRKYFRQQVFVRDIKVLESIFLTNTPRTVRIARDHH